MNELRDIQLSLPMQLLQAREAAMAEFRPMLRRHGLTEQQWRVLRVLAAEQTINTGDLAHRCFLLPPSLTRILQTLEGNGLIRRALDDDDQRRTLTSLTSAGPRLYRQVGPDSEALYQSIEARFGSKKLRALYDLLTEFTDIINA